MTPGFRANTVIAGVNKAGTTSLFVSLAAHPDVAAASVKETRYFLPARYGQPLEPVSVYEGYFRDAGDRRVRIEATPAYFYGDEPLIASMCDVLGPARVLVVLREPVSRLVSFFTSQKTRLRLPAEMSVSEYLDFTDRMTDADFRDPANEPYFGFRGGLYADHLPFWISAYGADLRVLFFDDLVARPADVLADVAVWLGIDPVAFPAEGLSSENRTTGFRNAGAQRFALAFNDRFEKFLRRHHGLKDRLRSAYYRINGRSAREAVPDDVRTMLRRRYEEPNARLEGQLRAAGVVGLGGTLPPWLGARGRAGAALRVERRPARGRAGAAPRGRLVTMAASVAPDRPEVPDGPGEDLSDTSLSVVRLGSRRRAIPGALPGFVDVVTRG